MTAACAAGVDTGFVTLGYGKVAVLGVVQGITELLPISSTAHMRVVPALLGWRDPGSAFSAIMQLAALAAVVSYLWQDVRRLAVGSLSALGEQNFAGRELSLAIWIALATIPIGVAGLTLSDALNACRSPLRALPVIGWACVAMGALMALTEVFAGHRRSLENGTLMDALLIGFAQVGALIPGVSRSGSTLTAALGLGFKREEAARFSFLLGIPAIALAGAKEFWALHGAGLDLHGWSVLALGLVTASVSAFAAIWTLMHVLERFSAWPFVVYRVAFGTFLLLAVSQGVVG